MNSKRVITSPLPGIAEWTQDGPGENGVHCVYFHYSVDPTKTHDWAVAESAADGGLQSPQWQTEMEGNPNAFFGKPTYWGYHPSRNIVSAQAAFGGPVPPKDWPKWTSWDFGQTNKTVCIFWARNPQTGRVFIWHEMSSVKTPDEFRSDVYRDVAYFYNINISDLDMEDYFEDHIGDRSGNVWMQWFGKSPYPINIRGYKDVKGVDAHQRKLASESQLNSAFQARFYCCGVWQIGRQDQDLSPCEMKGCQNMHRATPGLFIVTREGVVCAPVLVEQLPTIKRKRATQGKRNDNYDDEEKDEKVPHDSVDACRYGLMGSSEQFSINPVANSDDFLIEADVRKLSYEELMRRDRVLSSRITEEEQQSEREIRFVGYDSDEEDGEGFYGIEV